MIAFTRSLDAETTGRRLGHERRRQQPARAHEHGRDRGVTGLAADPRCWRGVRGPRAAAATCRSSPVASHRSSPSTSMREGAPGRRAVEPGQEPGRLPMHPGPPLDRPDRGHVPQAGHRRCHGQEHAIAFVVRAPAGERPANRAAGVRPLDDGRGSGRDRGTHAGGRTPASRRGLTAVAVRTVRANSRSRPPRETPPAGCCGTNCSDDPRRVHRSR